MNQAQAVVIIAAELRLFLRPGRRSVLVAVALDGTSSLGHVVESLRVPLTEAGRLLVDGEPAAPGYRPCNADVVTVEAVRRQGGLAADLSGVRDPDSTPYRRAVPWEPIRRSLQRGPIRRSLQRGLCS
jgi:Mut7-C ubiquitin